MLALSQLSSRPLSKCPGPTTTRANNPSPPSVPGTGMIYIFLKIAPVFVQGTNIINHGDKGDPAVPWGPRAAKFPMKIVPSQLSTKTPSAQNRWFAATVTRRPHQKKAVCQTGRPGFQGTPPGLGQFPRRRPNPPKRWPLDWPGTADRPVPLGEFARGSRCPKTEGRPNLPRY